jgi:hypothetical protein
VFFRICAGDAGSEKSDERIEPHGVELNESNQYGMRMKV